MTKDAHWDRVYSSRAPDTVSWYRRHLERSLAVIEELALDPQAPIIDVGGGASTLARDLLEAGHRAVSVLDVSAAALERARAALGDGAVEWIVGDVTRVTLPASHYAVWHDRAVFHFLTEAEDRRRYLETVRHALRPDGHVVIATFGPEGPTRCSGLDVVRYSAPSLAATFGEGFCLQAHALEVHRTPAGAEQQFLHCLFERIG